MASQVLGDDFTGTTFEGSAALLQTGATAVWNTESDDGTFSAGVFGRTSLGATLSATGVSGAIRRASAGITGMTLGVGVNVFEFSGYAQPRLRVFFGDVFTFVGLRVRNNGTGSWESNAGVLGSFSAGTHDLTTPVKLRIEVEAGTTRLYVDATLVATIASGHSVGTSVPLVYVQYATTATAGLPENTTNLLLKYVHFKTETVSGALGAPALGDSTAPVLSGVITITPTGVGSYTASWPAATDAVGVTGYETSLNGAAYVSNGTVLSKAFSGRPTGATDTLSVRAFDAAGNRSTALSTSAAVPTAILIQDDFRSGVLTPLRGSRWTGSAEGVWDAQEVGPPLGFSNANTRRASGGLISDVKIGAWVLRVDAEITNPSPIGTGVAVAQIAFYGNPTILISDRGAPYLTYRPIGPTAMVGTVGNLVEVADTTSLATRSEVEFRFGPAGTSILKNGASIYSDTTPTGQVPADFVIGSVEMTWLVGAVGAQLIAGSANVRLLDWVSVEHGRAASGSGAPPPTTPITNFQKVCVKPSKIYGSYVSGGVRTIIVPRGTQVVIKGENYEAGSQPPSVDMLTTLSHGSGAVDTRTSTVQSDGEGGVIGIPAGLRDEFYTPNAAQYSQRLVSPARTAFLSAAARVRPDLFAQVGPSEQWAAHYAWQAGNRGAIAPPQPFVQLTNFGFQTSFTIFNWVLFTDGGGGGNLFPATPYQVDVPSEPAEIPAVYHTQFDGYANTASALTDLAFSASDLGLPESDSLTSAVIKLSTSHQLQVCGGPADGFLLDRVVVLDVIPPAEITRYNITTYPDYDAKSRPLPDPDNPSNNYSNFWTAFDDSYEAP